MKIIITFLAIIIIFFSSLKVFSERIPGVLTAGLTSKYKKNYFNVSVKEDLYSRFGVKRLKIEPFAPVFTLKNLDGKEVNLEDYRGKVVLLNFWATWCEPCLEEMPALQKTYNLLKNKGFVVLAVSIDRKSRENNVRAFAKNLNLSFPILLDSDQNVLNKYFNNTLPTSYLINSKGKLKGFISGARDWGSEDAVALINILLQSID
jgi:peroxiredoxin